MNLKFIDWLVVGQTAASIGVTGVIWRPISKLAKPDEWTTSLNDTDLPFVSIIVPARNEANNIERCVASLLAQNYPNFEVIAINDDSTDATPQILERLSKGTNGNRLKILHLHELPEGWAGKPHAMQAGSEAASDQSQWLLFTDADTFHQPDALRFALSRASTKKIDLLSILPKMDLKSFWENVLMPLAVLGVSLQYPLDKVNSPESKLAVANGQFLLIRKSCYDQVGGYGGRLKSSLLDDRDLALAVKDIGGRVFNTNGRDLMSVRMYQNLGEIWSGWRKNAFVGSRSAFITVPFLIVLMLTNGVSPLLQFLLALLKLGGANKIRNRQRWKLWAWLSGLQLGMQCVVQYRLAKTMDISRAYSFCSPLAAFVFSGILIDSMWRSLTGRGVSWKGRNYAQAARNQQLIK